MIAALRVATLVLVAAGLLGMLRGSAPTDARVAEGPDGTGRVGAADARPATEPPAPAPLPAWTPAPQPGLSLALADRVRVLSIEQWRAIRAAFPEREEWAAARTMVCESLGDPLAIGDQGRAHGAWQVHPQWWGLVPGTLGELAVHAAAIVSRESWRPWTGAKGCPEWNR